MFHNVSFYISIITCTGTRYMHHLVPLFCGCWRCYDCFSCFGVVINGNSRTAAWKLSSAAAIRVRVVPHKTSAVRVNYVSVQIPYFPYCTTTISHHLLSGVR